MNTHDKIELPPLPQGEYRLSPDSRVPTLYDEEAMETYARAAVKADRKRRGEPVAWRVHPFDYGVGYEGAYALTSRPNQVVAWQRKGWEVQPLFTAPQSAEQQPYEVLFAAVMNTAEQSGQVRCTRPGDDKLAIVCREFLKAQ